MDATAFRWRSGMARVRIRKIVGQGSEKRLQTVAEIEVSPAFSLLNAMTKEGVVIRHDCGGKAICGTCRIRVASGTAGVSPMREKERVRLTAVGADADERLACQTYCARDADIEIPEKHSG